MYKTLDKKAGKKGQISSSLRVILITVIAIFFLLIVAGSFGALQERHKMKLETTTDGIATLLDMSLAFPEHTSVNLSLPTTSTFHFKENYIQSEENILNYNYSTFHTSSVPEKTIKGLGNDLKIIDGKVEAI
jgi:hypothetical protein